MTDSKLAAMTAGDFDASYQLRMIRAYPVIAQMDARGLMFGTVHDRREAFQRILNARNLQTTHRLYLADGATVCECGSPLDAGWCETCREFIWRIR